MPVPIWKDYTVQLGSASFSDFEIRLGSSAGEAIFSGRSYKRPGAAYCEARINDVCANYLRNRLPDPAALFTAYPVAATFSVVHYTDGAWTEAEAVTFYNDWSYDYGFDPAADPLSDPVVPLLDARQPLIQTSVGAGLTAVITRADGTTVTVEVSGSEAGSFSQAFNESYERASESGPGASFLDLSQYPGIKSVQMGGVTWRVEQTCARYALYYVNAHGCWDSLLIQGKAAPREDYDRHTDLVDYDNRDRTARGRNDYAVGVSPAWVLNTGYLSGEQAARMRHVTGSPQAYLFDLVEGAFIPVLITDTSVELHPSTRQLVNYVINAQLAQEQFRK